ncbi:hypothetical protein T4B_14453 [Trichinella pseudospiralis]|uniref:Uncharacterized protein n=1 Tax=Trichinella pseudospiralis TaxID=6337 RepID=A0A0V1GR37_TRIPS|nr:hypothetical protein T4B_14453 [Trichinella pseudospiralis]
MDIKQLLIPLWYNLESTNHAIIHTMKQKIEIATPLTVKRKRTYHCRCRRARKTRKSIQQNSKVEFENGLR